MEHGCTQRTPFAPSEAPTGRISYAMLGALAFGLGVACQVMGPDLAAESRAASAVSSHRLATRPALLTALPPSSVPLSPSPARPLFRVPKGVPASAYAAANEARAPSLDASGPLAAVAGALSMALAWVLRGPTRSPRAAPLNMHMASAAAHTTVAEPPAVLSRDEDPTCLKRRWEAMLRRHQERICAAIEECDGEGKFQTDAFVREAGGGGISRVLAGGKVWEKAGVNLSVVYGTMPSDTLQAARQRQASYAKELAPGERVPFYACGLSCVMHPRNPHCPTMHFNYRYFETEAGDWWFGGGTDLTPAYVDEEDLRHFHSTYKKACDKHDPAFFPKFKKWADDYFVIKHRGETRGLGGIFFDDLNDRDPETIFPFSEECLSSVVPAYVPIIDKNKGRPFTPEEKRWQLLRRGRYVEFNLVYDRGTIFGLKTGLGRMESIMMTLPETARWEYDHQPAPGSPEDTLLQACKSPRDWV